MLNDEEKEKLVAEAFAWIAMYLSSVEDGKSINLPDKDDLMRMWFALGETMGIAHYLPYSFAEFDDDGTPLLIFLGADPALMQHIENILDNVDMGVVADRVKESEDYN